jgi:PTS system nitrogen regulatory IIA component
VRIAEILTEPQIVPDLRGSTKDDVLRELAVHLCDNSGGLPATIEQVVHALVERERLGSTGVGEGVAIPHAKIPGLQHLVACFGRTTSGVPFDAIDQQPVTLIFVLLVPESSAGAHLKALARISRLLKDASFRGRLLQLPDQHAIYQAFLEEDTKH